jgi:hypothetical protein
MTQNQWLSSTDLSALLQFLKDDVRPRKFRLFACACLRQLRERTDDAHFRRTVVLAERFVEGDCERDPFRAAFRRAWPDGWERARVAALVAIDPLQRDNYSWRCLELANDVVDLLSGRPTHTWAPLPPDRDTKPSRQEQTDLLREIVGDPFTEVRFDPAWRTGDVVPLAESIAVDGTFAELPVLADALEDVGCDSPDVLDHLRAPSRHALGCWALDLVRGRR